MLRRKVDVPTYVTVDNPLAIDALARSTEARDVTRYWIDRLLTDSPWRLSGYTRTEVQDMLLDLRRLLDVRPR